MNQRIYDDIRAICLNDSAPLLCHPVGEGNPPIDGFNFAYNVQFTDQKFGVANCELRLVLTGSGLYSNYNDLEKDVPPPIINEIPPVLVIWNNT